MQNAFGCVSRKDKLCEKRRRERLKQDRMCFVAWRAKLSGKLRQSCQSAQGERNGEKEEGFEEGKEAVEHEDAGQGQPDILQGVAARRLLHLRV
jgi:hypothetical protein